MGGDHGRFVHRFTRSEPRESALAPYIAYCPAGTPLDDLIRIAGSRWAVEECFQSAKQECGLDDYQVRRCPGWHRHMTLAMAAHACLTVLRARQLDAGKAETDPPSSSTSASPRYDADHPPTAGPHPSGTSCTGHTGADDVSTRPVPVTTNDADTAPDLATSHCKHRCSASSCGGAPGSVAAVGRRAAYRGRGSGESLRGDDAPGAIPGRWWNPERRYRHDRK